MRRLMRIRSFMRKSTSTTGDNWNEGLAPSDIIRVVYKEIIGLDIPEIWKVRLSDTIGETDYRLIQGATAEVQLGTLLAKFALAGEEI